MKRFHCSMALLAGCALLLASCGKSNPTPSGSPAPTQAPAAAKPKDLVVGKWQGADPGKESEKLELAGDGTISGDSGGFKYTGKFTFLDDDTMQYDVKPDLGNLRRVKCKVKVSKDMLTLEIVDAMSRVDEAAKWQHDADDKVRMGQVEKYKKQP